MRSNLKHPNNGLLVGAAIIGALSLGGCATKEYVDKEVLRVDQTAQSNLDATRADLSAKNSSQDQQLAQLDTATREALERATAAGKLAEGKFLYSMVLSDDSVKFPVNRHELSPQAQARLDELVQKLKAENKNVYVEIQGHTDASGPPSYNEKLGEERAEAVRRYLAKNGIALNRLATISYGEEMPVADNSTRDGRAQNRRVVLVVLS
jgi:peptidoglycan-associated lipoprotein